MYQVRTTSLCLKQKHLKKVRTFRGHRSRIKHVNEFLEKNYNENFTLGTRELTEEEPQDQSKYWCKNKRDLICKAKKTCE